jgi:hypothetical protein
MPLVSGGRWHFKKNKKDMSRSIHTTYSKDIFGLTKRELEEQFNDPNSDLASLAEKSSIKARVKKERKDKRIEIKNINNENLIEP